MLGLAASHLSLCTDPGYASQALSHRVKAIRTLNAALSKPRWSEADGDARFAAFMVLTFQSSYMPEGMLDFVAMLRGCHVVASSGMMPRLRDSAFGAFSVDAHQDAIRALRAVSPAGDVLDEAFVEGFSASASRLGPLCAGAPELVFLAALEGIVRRPGISSVDGQS